MRSKLFAVAEQSPPVELGLRARQKIARRKRIEEAARAVFREKGYEAATTREIAARAEVSIGTLFAYVTEKRELLTMVFRDDMRLLTERTFATLPEDAGVLDQLLHVFHARYKFWRKDPELSRHAVRESTVDIYRPEGPRSPLDHDAPPQFLLQHMLHGLVAANQRRGRIRAEFDAETVTRLILDIYINESRMWIAQAKPSIPVGIERLRVVLELALVGVLC